MSVIWITRVIAKIKENGDDNKIAMFPTVPIPYNSYIINKHCPIENNMLSRYILSPTCNNPYKQHSVLYGNILLDNCSKRSYQVYYSNIPFMIFLINE